MAHAPQGTVLHWVIQKYYRSWVDTRSKPLPYSIQREFEHYLRCGDPAFGHATLVCPSCGYTREIPFSCKTRSFCTYCLKRRMWHRSQHIIDRILQDHPVRHWVLSLPPRLRHVLGHAPKLLSRTLNCFVQAISRHLRRKAKRLLRLRSISMVHVGTVSVIHRSSADLTINIHFHCLVPDGVFVQRSPGGKVEFHELPELTDAEIESVAWQTCRRTVKMLEREDGWCDTQEDPAAQTIRGVLTLASRKPTTFFGAVAKPTENGRVRRPGEYPFDVHARRRVRRGDRRELEQLVQYVLSPPFFDHQLSIGADGRVNLLLKRQRHDGVEVVSFDPYVLLEKLATLVPKAKSNAIRFHGVYGANSRLRSQVCIKRSNKQQLASVAHDAEKDRPRDDRKAKAYLYHRAHGVDFQRCPLCLDTLQLAVLVSHRVNYRNPQWVAPDIPQEPTHARVKTGQDNASRTMEREPETQFSIHSSK